MVSSMMEGFCSNYLDSSCLWAKDGRSVYFSLHITCAKLREDLRFSYMPVVKLLRILLGVYMYFK